MPEALPPELVALFAARDPDARELAWAHFVSLHSGLLLRAARTLGRDYDGAMDRYAFALERLQERDYHRLRAYRPDAKVKFTTWLLVVFRRLCLDHYRQRYGRSPADERAQDAGGDRRLRRHLADGIPGPVDPDLIEAPGRQSPEAELTNRHRSERLGAVLSALSPADRLLLKLRFDDDLSASTIARMMGFPTPFHVYRRLNAVFLSLRRALKAVGIEASEG